MGGEGKGEGGVFSRQKVFTVVTPTKLVPAKAGSGSPEVHDFPGFPFSRE